jgi:hypothetical protein
LFFFHFFILFLSLSLALRLPNSNELRRKGESDRRKTSMRYDDDVILVIDTLSVVKKIKGEK